MAKFTLKFRFDYGAGGCLWAGDEATRDQFGVGPLDATLFDVQGNVLQGPILPLSKETLGLIEDLDHHHAGYLNPKYPPDPSLWTQALCDSFNDRIEVLLPRLKTELGPDFDIIDQQWRYSEDPALAEYLSVNPDLSAMTAFPPPSVR